MTFDLFARLKGLGSMAALLVLAGALALAPVAGGAAQEAAGQAAVGQAAAGQAAAGDKEPITLDILDDDALLLIRKTDGRDIVHVLGRAVIRHKERTVETDELVYDEESSYAIMDGDVRLTDTGEDGLNLTADHLELDLNSEAALARGDVRFVRKESRGAADVLRHGEYESLQAEIDAALAGRPAATVERVRAVLQTFLPDDKVLLLEGNVDLVDGDREFRSELVVINTRDDALVSVGRSAAVLPGPEDD